MDIHPWKSIPDGLKRSHILHNDRIQAVPVKWFQISIEQRDFPVFYQCIHREIKTQAMQMRLVNRLQKFFF